VKGSLGVYVHIPFCNYSCTFCFYARRIGDGQEEMQRYVRALLRELEGIEPGTSLTQLYMGGGTPTALPADLLDQVLQAVFGRMDRGSEGIHTVECSPESVTADHLDVISKHGVGRLSMGIQTLSEVVLDHVNRRHGCTEALEACTRLVSSGRIVNV